jgi:hypothetical protein
MIRPFTCLCFLLACGSGLYLYQSKHRVQMLDREIERTVHMTEATRDQARLLGAEWMLLNDPERLRTLADQFLTLKTVTPTQFTTMADLDRRLPPVRSPDAPLEPVPEPAVMTPMIPPPGTAPATPPATSPGAMPSMPAPPVAATAPATPAPAPVAAPAPRPAPLVAERKPAPEKPRVVAESRQPEPRQTEPRQAEPRPALMAAATPRPTPPRYAAPIAPVAAPMPNGSALGMASRTALPPPTPIESKPIGLFPALDH